MEVTRLFDVMHRQAKTAPISDALVAKIKGEWQPWSSQETVAMANRLSLGLLAAGIKKGDRVAIISMNRPEWVLSDLAVLQLGAVVVPLYPTATAGDYEYILAHAGVRLVFVSTPEIWSRVEAMRTRLPKLERIYTYDEVPGADHWQTLVQSSAARTDLDVELDSALVAARSHTTPDDTASLIYTSGTTGTPKGVILSHRNIVCNVKAIAAVIPLTHMQKALSFLPLSHVFERTGVYFYQYQGIGIYFAESIDTIAKNLAEVSPDVIITVPRLLEKIYFGITAKGRELRGVKRALFDWSIKLGLEHDPDHPLGAIKALRLAIARRLIFSKWQAALGGKLRLVIVGGSALQPRLGRIFWAAGIATIEGYGLTESAPVITCNTPTHHRIGTAGRPLPGPDGVEIKIIQEEGYRQGEGEICVRGPSIMTSYLNNPEATRESLDPDGWFHSGDIGFLDPDGYLKITDRKKEMFKTSGGKYIAPLAIESKFRECPLISQIMVIGEHQKFPSALIVPDFKVLAAWAHEHGLAVATPAELVRHEDVLSMFAWEVESLNRDFGQWEKIKRFRLIADEWTIANGEVTPKLSLRRKVIINKHKDLIEQIYASAGLGG